jgi:hypothetical protein
MRECIVIALDTDSMWPLLHVQNSQLLNHDIMLQEGKGPLKTFSENHTPQPPDKDDAAVNNLFYFRCH